MRTVILSICFSAVSTAIGYDTVPAQHTAPVDEVSAAIAGSSSNQEFLTLLASIRPEASINDPEQAAHAIAAAHNGSTGDLHAYITKLRLYGLLPDEHLSLALNEVGHNDLMAPALPNLASTRPNTLLYTTLNAEDAPFSRSEEDLRSAIRLPPGFSNGTTRPLLLVPGTASNAEQTFGPNLGKQFANSEIADPVFLNVPNFMLSDIQGNAEYIAYAINYLAKITNRTDVAVATWSQGSIATAWALQYWPSTRKVTTDVINASADYKGTLADMYLLCRLPFCSESIRQQAARSKFIEALRRGGGGSAYVPTTSVYSVTDIIVTPQFGRFASAIVEDKRHVGVTNAEVQEECFMKQAGGTYGHEGVLYHPLFYALTVDALTHDGPGDLSRLDLDSVCDHLIAPGLDISDMVATVEAMVQALINCRANPNATAPEPVIRPYALNAAQ